MDLIYQPSQLIDRSLKNGWISKAEAKSKQAKEIALEIAEETTEDWPEDEGFGSSDIFGDLIQFLKQMGKKVEVKHGKIQLVKESVILSFDEFVNEGLKSKDPNSVVTIDIDFIDDGHAHQVLKKYNLRGEPNGANGQSAVDLTGKKKDILAYMQSKYYDMDPEDIEDMYPELLESETLNEAADTITIDEITDPVLRKKFQQFVKKNKAEIETLRPQEMEHWKDGKPDSVSLTGDYSVTFKTWSVWDSSRGPLSEWDSVMIGNFFTKSEAAKLAKLLNSGLAPKRKANSYKVVPTGRSYKMHLSLKDDIL